MEEKTVILVLNKKLVVRRMTLWAKRNIADQEYSKQSTIMMIKNVKGGTDMADQKLIDEVGKYIDKYYEPIKDDIKMDKEMLSIFDKITRLREKIVEEKALQEQPDRRIST